VVQAFEEARLGAAVRPGIAGGRAHVDLRAAVIAQLAAGGVRAVDVSDRCTYEDRELWSYRRDVTHAGGRATGRLGALIAVRPAS
jgi:copper oxidase (laccase) domain-containing protein